MKKALIGWIVFAVSLLLVGGTGHADPLVLTYEWFQGDYSVSPSGVTLDAETHAAYGDEDAYYGFCFVATAPWLHVHYEYLRDMNVAWGTPPPEYLWTDALMYLDEGGGWSGTPGGSVFIGRWAQFRYEWPTVPEGPYSNPYHVAGTADGYYPIEVGREYNCCLGVWADVYGYGSYTASAHSRVSNFQAEYAAPIPVPGAVWLLGSGLVGLVGLARRFRS